MALLNENELYQAWKSSPAETKELVLEELQKLLFRHARAVCILRIGEAPGELVNTIVWEGVRQIQVGKFRGECKFSTWFQQIAMNLADRSLRGKVRDRKNRPLDDCEEGEFAREHPMDLKLQLEQAMEGLSPEEMELIEGKQYGMEDKELAERLGVGEAAIRQRWSRLRAKLRARLRGEDAGT